MIRRLCYALLLLLVLIMNCNLTSEDVSDFDGASTVINSLIDQTLDKGGILLEKYEEGGIDSIEHELYELLDLFGVSEDGKMLISYIKEALCDSDIVDAQGNFKTYDYVEFYELLNNFGADKIIAIVNHLLATFNALREAELAISKISDQDLKRSVQIRFDLKNKDYKLDLKKVFSEFVFDELYNKIVSYNSSYIDDFVNIKIDATSILETEHPKSYYLTLSDDMQKGFDYIKSVVTDPEIAKIQGYKTYSDDEFDALLNDWSIAEVKNLVKIHLGYLESMNYIMKRISFIENIGEIEASIEIKNRISESLRIVKKVFEDNFFKLRDSYPVFLKKVFDQSFNFNMYKDFQLKLSVFILWDSNVQSFPSLYNSFSSIQKEMIEDARYILFDAAIFVGDDAVKLFDFYFYIIFLRDKKFFDVLKNYFSIKEKRKDILEMFANFVKGSFESK
ncbi:Hypothetical protein BCD_1256 (plasmid) [Borrelia crocidurae DOU]|uniref:Lipoprotein n=1 Tax=Borrelia crocidurae DOU TaxID=1293575 RepID=W5SK75_9SPIR|nr:hypothetical protein [Borrelia crocidurae]AHH07322.1 Hypothetical protein BCD_1256 [Borrelia crocidurae DOU]